MTQNNKPIHRIEYYDKEKTKKHFESWKLNGKYHREDGPAFIEYRNDGSIWSKHYCINGKFHREDGPAFIEYNSNGNIASERYYINGIESSKEEYLKLISLQNRIKVLLNDTE